MDHTWVACNRFSQLPPFAVQAGYDTDKAPIFVGRSYHYGNMLPAKVIPYEDQLVTFVAWNDKEINKYDFEILTGHYYHWVPTKKGEVPTNALRIGQTSDGDPLYVGRGHMSGSLTPGRVYPSHSCLYIPFGGEEHKLKDYEVLVHPETWVTSSGSNIVPNMILAGHDSDGDAIYVARANHEGDLLPAKFIPSKSCAFVSYGGQVHIKNDFQLLAGYGYGWVPDSYGNVPDGAIMCGRTSDGEGLYIGRGHYQGSFTPGKIHQSHRCLYIPFRGQEVRLDNYEVLVRN